MNALLSAFLGVTAIIWIIVVVPVVFRTLLHMIEQTIGPSQSSCDGFISSESNERSRRTHALFGSALISLALWGLLVFIPVVSLLHPCGQ